MLEIRERCGSLEPIDREAQRPRVAVGERPDTVGDVGEAERAPDPTGNLRRRAGRLGDAGGVVARDVRHQHAVEGEQRQPPFPRRAFDVALGRTRGKQKGPQVAIHARRPVM